MEKKNQINFERFLYVLRVRIIWMILIGIIVGVGAGVATKLLVTPEYYSHAKFYVNATNSQTNSISQSDLNVAKSLVDTYIEIFKSDTFLEQIAEVSGVNYTPAQFRKRMTASSVGGTEIFKVSISDNDPKRAYLIISAIAEKGPSEIKRVVDCGNVSVVDYPKLPTEPSSTGAKRNAIFGAILGAAASFAVFFLKEMFDVTIYTEEDLGEFFKYPIIGTIPTIVNQDQPSTGAKTKKDEKSRRKGKNAYNYGYGYETVQDSKPKAAPEAKDADKKQNKNKKDKKAASNVKPEEKAKGGKDGETAGK
ncbi:MAG: hypothetical protein IKN38_05155 [Clostridia bacterium]|nr:hypothetical protein [Clostridia bacterium]